MTDHPENTAARAALRARRGTAYFARKLNELPDTELYGPSLRHGWTRAHLVTHVSYHARAIARLVEGVRTGTEQAMYPSAAARDAEIELAATLPPRALRDLFHHAEVHLNVEWRDLQDPDWDAELRLLDGTVITARQTPMIRSKLVWQAAIDLGNGGRLADVPQQLRQRLAE